MKASLIYFFIKPPLTEESHLVDVVKEVAALDQQDVVHIGTRGRLVQGQATQTNIAGQVLIQHTSTCSEYQNIIIIAEI